MEQMFELLVAGVQKQEMQRVISCNERTRQFGLTLTEEDVKGLMVCRTDALKEQRRVEFGGGILPDIIYAFCDSDFISQDNYTETLGQLQEIFYLFKNEAEDELTDAELIDFMRRQFDEICFGDLEYLRSTCLERFARAVLSGYQCQLQHRLRDEYAMGKADNEYGGMDEETRWEFELYRMGLEDVF